MPATATFKISTEMINDDTYHGLADVQQRAIKLELLDMAIDRLPMNNRESWLQQVCTVLTEHGWQG